MANSFLTIDMITHELLRRLVNNITYARNVNRQYDPQFGVEGAKIGNTLRIRKPPRYEAVSGPDITSSIQDYADLSETLTLDTQKTVPVSWLSSDETLSIDAFGERYLEGAAATLANAIDADGLALYKHVALSVGTAGSTPSALLTYSTGKAYTHKYAAPQDGMWSSVVEPLAEATIVDALKGLFQDSTEISRQYRDGKMGRASGMDWSMDQNVNTHTTGTHDTGSTPTVDGGGQTGSSLVTQAWANSTAILKQGDVITLAGVNGLNYFSYADTGLLRQFVVTADVTSSGAGAATIPIWPPITTTGQQRTVSASPADTAAITVYGAEDTNSPQNMIYHRDFCTLGMAPLAPLPGAENSTAIDEQLNIMVTVARQGDIKTHQIVTRADVLYGWKVLYPDLACRVWG